jgi:WD40 repeat protein
MATEAVKNHAQSIETQQTLQAVLSLFPAPGALFTHQSAVAFADISPDRQPVATAAAKDGALWRVADRTRVANLDGATRTVVFSPDGTHVAGCCQQLGVWTAAGTPVLRFTPRDLDGEPETIAFSPDSRRLAVGLQRGSTVGVVVVDVATKAKIFRQQTTLSGNATAIAFAPNGDLALGFRDTIEIVSGTTWLPVQTLSPQSGGVNLIAFRADGRYLASLSNDVVSVFDLTSGNREARLQIRGDAPSNGTALAFSRDGQYLGAVGGFAGAIWAVRAWREAVYVRHGEFQTLASVSFSDVSREAVSCGWDGYCIGWSLESGARVHQFAHQHAYATDDAKRRALFRGTFARQSSVFVTAGADGTARLWNLAPVNEAGRSFCEGNLLVWSFLPSGRTWSAHAGSHEIVHRACRPGRPDDRRFDRSVVDSAVGKHAALALPGDVVRVLETETGKAIAELQHVDPIDWDAVQRRLGASMSERAAAMALQGLQSGSVKVLAVSPSGKIVATHRDADQTLRIWDASTSQVVHKEISERAPLIEFLSDTTVLRLDDRRTVSMRRVAGGSSLWSESLEDITALAVSDDRQRILAAAREGDGSVIRVFEAASGQRLLDQRVEMDVGEVVFDRSGRYAAARLGSGLGVPEGLPQGTGLKIWDVSTGREVVSLPESQKVVGLAFSHDGGRVAVVLQQGGLIVQDLVSGQASKTVGASAGPVAFSSTGRWLAFGGRSIRVLETNSLRVVAQVDVIRQARRVEFRSDDRVLAVDSFPDGDPQGLTQLLRWMPGDVLGDACRVMPLAAAARQWQQLFPESSAPTPCGTGGHQ